MIGSQSHRVSRHPAAPITPRHILCSTTSPEVPQREHRAGNGTPLGGGTPGNTVSHGGVHATVVSRGMGVGINSAAWVGRSLHMNQVNFRRENSKWQKQIVAFCGKVS